MKPRNTTTIGATGNVEIGASMPLDRAMTGEQGALGTNAVVGRHDFTTRIVGIEGVTRTSATTTSVRRKWTVTTITNVAFCLVGDSQDLRLHDTPGNHSA